MVLFYNGGGRGERHQLNLNNSNSGSDRGTTVNHKNVFAVQHWKCVFRCRNGTPSLRCSEYQWLSSLFSSLQLLINVSSAHATQNKEKEAEEKLNVVSDLAEYICVRKNMDTSQRQNICPQHPKQQKQHQRGKT